MVHNHKSSLCNRRDFLRVGGSALSLGMMSGFIPPVLWNNYSPVSSVLEDQRIYQPVNDPSLVRAIALAAIDAATSAGAEYADVRLTRIVSQNLGDRYRIFDQEMIAVGVRAMYGGAWGFASSPYWHIDEVQKLAQSALRQAKANAKISSRDIDLGSYPVVEGAWMTPIQIDPFQISVEEKSDFVRSLDGLMPRRVKDRMLGGYMSSLMLTRRENATATSGGSYFTQVFHEISSDYRVYVGALVGTALVDRREVQAEGLGHRAGGWEQILNANIREQIPTLIEKAEAALFTPEKPIDVGKYEVVCDARTIARLVRGTLAEATQIDRALGYEANSAGTSYLGPDPMEHLGTTLGTPLLNVRGDRTMAGGLATARWDEEGVETEPFDIVSQGVFVDYQTNREQASWLAPWYEKQGKSVKSHGCARVESAINMPMQFSPNLSLSPGSEDIGFDDIVASIPKGLAIINGYVDMDFQAKTGIISTHSDGEWREIVNGKLGAIVVPPGLLFDSTQIWKTVQKIGGPKSVDTISSREEKGEPSHTCDYTVAGVPALFKEASVINREARA